MMKQNQTLYAAGILVVLAILYFFTQTGEVATKSIDTVALAFDKNSAAFIDLSGNEAMLSMTKSSTGWMLDAYPVDTNRVKQLLDLFSDLKVDRLITRSDANYEKYEVTENGTRLTVRDQAGDQLLDILIGKRGANYQETFVRSYDQDEVYAVKSSLGHFRSKEASFFWDKRMTHLNVDQIDQFTMKGEFTYELKREGLNWTYNGEAVDFQKVVDMLKPIENLKASNFADEITPENEFYQRMQLVLQDGQQIELTFYLKDADSALVLAKVSGNDKVFEYSKAILNRFNKEIDDLKADPPPEES